MTAALPFSSCYTRSWHLDPAGEDHPHRLSLHDRIPHPSVLSLPWKMSEHIIRQIIPGRLFSHSDPDPREYLRTEMSNDIFDPVMASRASFLTDAQLSDSQIDVS